MSDLEKTPEGRISGSEADENEVRRLLEMAGRRQPVPEDDLVAITAAARATWRKQVARNDDPPFSLRSRWPWALAAAVVAALGAALWWGGLGTVEITAPPAVVAQAQRVWGTASVEQSNGPGSEIEALAEGQALAAGSRIETTGEGTTNRVALLLDGGTSLRLDHGSRVRLISATHLELEAGALYLDTGQEDRPAVVVHTPYGTVTDIGTQFSVRLPTSAKGGSPLLVRVREGAVEICAAADGAQALRAGTELLLTADGSQILRQITPYGPEWDWILDAAPRFEVEGMTLARFLSLVTRETGWSLRIDDPALAATTETTVLHGTTGSLRPDRAALAALAGAGLRGEVADGILTLSRAPGP